MLTSTPVASGPPLLFALMLLLRFHFLLAVHYYLQTRIDVRTYIATESRRDLTFAVWQYRSSTQYSSRMTSIAPSLLLSTVYFPRWSCLHNGAIAAKHLITSSLCPANYRRMCLAALLTASSLTFPVSRRIVPSVAFGENSGIGLGRFLFRVSLRFC